ncbi:13E12 repeat family protein [Pseudonocardia kujensis]|nr:DUF222 domain-containing protein [Pseudonocardia kujensis]MCE0764424.1 13E12 repeat family protein [Pseudonocardia kujensis]
MVAVGYANPDRPFAAGELPDPHLDWADEIRAALAWTRRAADGCADEAVALVVELPAVWAALECGHIDWPKAAVFLRHLVGLPAGQVGHLRALVLPRARRWTTSEISRRLRRLILEIDPAHDERLFRRAHARRSVSACVTEDGTATLSAHGVAPEDADAAVARIDRLAHLVRRGGHPGRLDQIRVDLFVGFLDGRLHMLTDAEVIAALLHDAASDTPDAPTGRAPARPPRPRSAPPDGPAAVPCLAGRTEIEPAGTDRAEPKDSETKLAAERGSGGSEPVESRGRGAAAGTPANPRRGVAVQIALSTLLGLDERPATLPALGPIPASRARRLVAAQHRAPWRYALTGPDGRLIRAGALRTRPHPVDLGPPTAATDPAAPGLVDLLVDAALLTRLTAPDSDLPDSWRPVLAEIHAARGRALDDDPGARFPHTGLRRHVELRDRHCTFTGCLAPARTADLGPHPRPRPRRPDHRRGSRPDLPPRPRAQTPRLDPHPTRARRVRLAQPPRADLPHPRRTAAPAPTPARPTRGRPVLRRRRPRRRDRRDQRGGPPRPTPARLATPDPTRRAPTTAPADH